MVSGDEWVRDGGEWRCVGERLGRVWLVWVRDGGEWRCVVERWLSGLCGWQMGESVVGGDEWVRDGGEGRCVGESWGECGWWRWSG